MNDYTDISWTNMKTVFIDERWILQRNDPRCDSNAPPQHQNVSPYSTDTIRDWCEEQRPRYINLSSKLTRSQPNLRFFWQVWDDLVRKTDQKDVKQVVFKPRWWSDIKTQSRERNLPNTRLPIAVAHYFIHASNVLFVCHGFNPPHGERRQTTALLGQA